MSKTWVRADAYTYRHRSTENFLIMNFLIYELCYVLTPVKRTQTFKRVAAKNDNVLK